MAFEGIIWNCCTHPTRGERFFFASRPSSRVPAFVSAKGEWKVAEKRKGKIKLCTRNLSRKSIESDVIASPSIQELFFTSFKEVSVFFINIPLCHTSVPSMEHGRTPLAYLASSLGLSPPPLDFFSPQGIIGFRDSIKDFWKSLHVGKMRSYMSFAFILWRDSNPRTWPRTEDEFFFIPVYHWPTAHSTALNMQIKLSQAHSFISLSSCLFYLVFWITPP